MSLNNVEEVGTSLPDVQPREMQILEGENDANVQQNFNTSTCNVCNRDAIDKHISCCEWDIQIHYRCRFLPSYQRHYFTESKCNCTPTGLVDLSSDGIDKLINNIKENLLEIQKIKQSIKKRKSAFKGRRYSK